MDTRTVGKALLEKVRCIGGLLDHEDKPATESFNDLVFGTSSPPVPSRQELIYWYHPSLSWLTKASFYV
jgi:hypothetical protein